MFLLGNYQHTLDDKNRIRLPSKLRDDMGKKYIVLPGVNGCLAVYPAEGEQKLLQALQDMDCFDPERAELLRSITEFADSVEPDNQGRFILKDDLMEIAGIKKDVRIIGAINKVEIWSEEAYQARRANQDRSPAAFDQRYKKLHEAMSK